MRGQDPVAADFMIRMNGRKEEDERRSVCSRLPAPVRSFLLAVALIAVFLIILLISIDHMGFPTVIETRYKFPAGLKDICRDPDCQVGSECIRAKDGKKSDKCLCSEKCITYADASGSVCGSDGRDYISECELRHESCLSNRSIKLRFSGHCDPCDHTDCPPHEFCQLDESRNPVCRCHAA